MTEVPGPVTDVLIVGAGPAGLAAAIELRRLGVGTVLVVDREQQPGGIPRHSAHTGYGVRDLHRALTGPAYARHYVLAARAAGAEVLSGTTVTDLAFSGAAFSGAPAGAKATFTSPAGRGSITAHAVLLATGCRERPRHARLVPGDRPAGIMTTGELQQRVYLSGQRLPGRALVVGAEHVSFSAMVTLAHAGAHVRALITDQPTHQSFAAFRLGALARWRVPVWTSTVLRQVIGRDRLRSVELAHLPSGRTRVVDCDTLVFTGDWVPDYELARLAGVAMDVGTKGPAVDTKLRTSIPRLFAAGNLVHAAETADVAALAGRHAARQIAAALLDGPPGGDGGDGPGRGQAPLARPTAVSRAVPIEVAAPLAWIAPNAVAADLTPPPRGRFVLRSEGARRRVQLEVRQDNRLLARVRIRLAPGRSLSLPAAWVAEVDPAGGSVHIGPA